MWPPRNNIGDCLCCLFVFGGKGHHHLLSFVYIELKAGVPTPLHEVQKSRAMMLCVTSVMNVCLYTIYAASRKLLPHQRIRGGHSGPRMHPSLGWESLLSVYLFYFALLEANAASHSDVHCMVESD